jgi:hypothetical protein
MSNALTAARVKEVLEYDPASGVLKWRKTGKGRRLDLVAGSVDRHGYLQTRVDGRIYFNHRLAWLYVYGEWPKNVIDHINGNPADNRIENLRDVCRKTNQENQRKAAASNKTTGLLGASLHSKTGKFVASIQTNRKTVYLGLYKTPDQAHQAYITAKHQLHEGATI